MKFNDLKIKSYNPKGLKQNVLQDDFRLLLAYYCQKERGNKVKASFEELLNLIRLVVIELSKFDMEFHPKRMKKCSRAAFEKALSKEFPKDVSVPISKTDFDGVYLFKPHAALVADGTQSKILLSEHIDSFKEPLYFADEDFIYGYVLLSKPDKVSVESVLKSQNDHMVTKKEVSEHFDTDNLFLYDIVYKKLWDKPVSFKLDDRDVLIDYHKLYPVLRKIKQLDTLPVRHSGKGTGKEIVLNQILKPLSKPIMEKEDFITLTGAIVNNGKSRNDIDIVIKKDKPDDLRDDIGFKFRIYRGLDKELGDRIHWLYDDYNGSITSHIPLYHRWLIPASVPADEIIKLSKRFELQPTIHKMSNGGDNVDRDEDIA